MTSVIARQASRPYLRAMAAALFRLLAIAALVLMPAGMAAAPAAAAAAPAAEHCADQQQPDQMPVEQGADCTAMCSIVPAMESPEVERLGFRAPPSTLTQMLPIGGIEPEADTPPPRRG